MLSIEIFLSVLSTEPIYVLWSPAMSARASCDKPSSPRFSFRFRARISLADKGFLFFVIREIMSA